MGTLIEGLEAARQPCTLVLVLPAVALALLARRRAPLAIGSYVVGAAAVAWAQAAGYWRIEVEGWATVPAAATVGAAAIAVMWSQRVTGMSVALAPLGGVATGAVFGWLWRPCAGPRLSDVLNSAADAPVRTAGGMVLYVSGATLPAILLAALPEAFPGLSAWRDHRAATAAGLGITLVLIALLAAGRYDDVVAELVRRTTA